MPELSHHLSKVIEERQKLAEEECLLKSQRYVEIGRLAEACGALTVPNDILADAFARLAHDAQS